MSSSLEERFHAAMLHIYENENGVRFTSGVRKKVILPPESQKPIYAARTRSNWSWLR